MNRGKHAPGRRVLHGLADRCVARCPDPVLLKAGLRSTVKLIMMESTTRNLTLWAPAHWCKVGANLVQTAAPRRSALLTETTAQRRMG